MQAKLITPRDHTGLKTLLEILQKIGVKSLEDRISVAPVDCFENLDGDIVIRLVTEYRLSYVVPNERLDAERKLEIVNRVLELRHGLILDSVKEVDNKSEDIGTNRQICGYRLEVLPGGY